MRLPRFARNDRVEMAPSTRSRPGLPVFFAVFFFFFVSGACGLLYQVVWMRKLVLLFGTTSFAVSTVLSVFFLGLGLGSLWGGRLADRTHRPLYVYGLIEVAVGVWALLFIVLIGSGEALVVELLRWAGPSRMLGVAMRGLMATLLLIVPVTLMGATLPLLARFITARGPILGSRIGALYSVNTLGAVSGCAVTGFILLAQLGYTRTTLVGAALNIAVGIFALAMSRKVPIEPGAAEVPAASLDLDSDEAGRSTPSYVGVLVLSAFALSGFCFLAFEVLWTRLLTIVFLGTTYAFTTMLTTVLAGIVAGSAVAAALADRVKHRVAFFGFVQVLTAAACVAMLSVFPRLPEMLSEAQLDAGYSWKGTVYAKFSLSFLALFAPTFLFGMSFPLALKAFTESRDRVGRAVGRLYAANTLGGVVGALVGGYVLLPAVGTHQGIVLLSVLLGAGGLVLVIASPALSMSRRGLLAVSGAGAFALCMWMAPPDVSLALTRSFLPEDHEMIHYSEGVEGTVVVSSPAEAIGGSDRVLWINAVQATASIEKGVKMNRFQGFLPFLFDRDLDNALFMCFGSGITAGTLALSPFDRIDVIELSQDVLDAAALFGADNFDVLESPRINPIVDDGRNFLLTTSNRYDLITFEPMPLALAGVSTFYTKEYYELCRARLAPGGLVSQWIPLHNGLTLELVKDLFKTFVDTFPESSAWFINADMFLIGSNEPLRIDYARVERRLSENAVLREGLAEVYLSDVPELMASFFMGKDQLRRFTEGAHAMTDDRPWAEFLAPQLIYESNVAEILEAMAPFRESVIGLVEEEDSERWEDIREALLRRHRAHVQDMEGLKVYYGGIAFSEPDREFRKSLEIDPDDANAKYYLTEVLLARGQLLTRWDEFEKAVAALTEAAGYAPERAEVHLALGDAYFESGEVGKASRSYARYLDLGGAAERAVERGPDRR